MNTVHPMLTNILADPGTWQKSIDLADESLSVWLETPRAFKRIYLVGHGSSLYNAQVGEYVLEHIAGVPSKAIPAFAFSAYMEQKLLDSQTLVIGISTTGETQSVCEALERACEAGSPTLAITAHKDSVITHNADAVIRSLKLRRISVPNQVTEPLQLLHNSWQTTFSSCYTSKQTVAPNCEQDKISLFHPTA